MKVKLKIIFLAFFSLIKFSSSWTLSSLNLTQNGTSIIHVSVYYNRAFLCLSHDYSDITPRPTFIESSWPETLIGSKAKVFPNEIYFQKKKANRCREVQQAKATDIDEKGRLWLIDEGNEICAPKLFVFDLLYFNEEIHFTSFGLLQGKKFSKIIVDPVESENGDVRAYLSLYNEDYLLVYSFDERKIGKLKFSNDFIQPSKSPSFSEMIITPQKDQMYISDTTSGYLYTINLAPIRYLNFSLGDSKKLSIRSPLTYVGQLLGPPKAMTINKSGILVYIIPRFSAVAMWDPKTPLAAEWHEIVYQTNHELVQLLCGSKGSVYVISEKVVKISRDGKWKHSVKIHME
ncbi:hypothetical protein PVAND_017338 [Polypedilum vanderplanki]|uniref:Uncharacterized protein n=1 Tax=Polypedilum vanderplanki TaxID=319348 RepID=A0A9J6BIS1_POLVA|nr:hypothetical protein PVAND_017338 [Polypedilum vanderplanki]